MGHQGSSTPSFQLHRSPQLWGALESFWFIPLCSDERRLARDGVRYAKLQRLLLAQRNEELSNLDFHLFFNNSQFYNCVERCSQETISYFSTGQNTQMSEFMLHSSTCLKWTWFYEHMAWLNICLLLWLYDFPPLRDFHLFNSVVFHNTSVR